MSRGAICSYSFLARITAGNPSTVVSLAAIGGAFVIPPRAGWLLRATVKANDAALTGGNYDFTIWATASAVPRNRALYEVDRVTGIAPTGGVGTSTPDLNKVQDTPYAMQHLGGVFTPDWQVEIDTGAAEAADRDFFVVLEIQGDQSPASPSLAVSRAIRDNNQF